MSQRPCGSNYISLNDNDINPHTEVLMRWSHKELRKERDSQAARGTTSSYKTNFRVGT